MGARHYAITDFVFDVKRACAREGVPFDNDLYNSIIRMEDLPMSPKQAIQPAQPTWNDLLRIPQGWLTEELLCTRCCAVLVSSPEPEGHEWFIRFLSCRTKNVLILTLRVVGWRH